MKTHTTAIREDDPRLPLLRAIQREVSERRCALRVAEAMSQALGVAPRHHAQQIARLCSEISSQRRALRLVEKELRRLGIAFDAEHPQTVATVAAAPGPQEGAPARPPRGGGAEPRTAERRSQP